MFGGGFIRHTFTANISFMKLQNTTTWLILSVKVIWALSGFRAPDERPDHILHHDDPEPGHTTGLTVPGGGDAVSNL